MPGDQTRPVNLELGPDLITLSFVYDEEGNQLRLTGWSTEQGWQGNAYTPAGELVSWSLGQRGVPDSASSPGNAQVAADLPAVVLYPFTAYGRETLPRQQDFLVRGATVWTNEAEGVNTDVLVRDGRIAEEATTSLQRESR